MGPFGSNIKKDSFVSSGVPILNGSNLTGFSTNDRDLRYVTEDKAKSLGKALAARGDVVVTHRGTLGQIAYIPMNSRYENYIISQSQFRLKCDKTKVLPEYLVYYFHMPLGKWKLLSNTTQTGVPALGRPTSTFKKLYIELPSIEQQSRILRVIQSLQDKISLNQQINDYLAETAVALFNRECSQSNEPNAMLSDIAQITMGQSPSGSSYNEEGDGEVFYQGRAEFGAFFPRRRLFTTKPKRMAQEGDTLMSVRAPVGDLNIANENCCIGRGLAAIHSENNQSFVHYLVRAQRRILNTFNGDGTVFGSINGKTLKELPVFLPGNDVIAHLESQLKSIDELIRRNDDEMQALEQMRDTLLPRLMSGEIDVSQIEVPKQLNNHLYGY